MQNFNYNQNNIRKSLPKVAVLMLILMALVPYGWATQYSATAHYVIDHLLGGEPAHIVGHFLLFMLMGTAVLVIFPRLKQHPTLYFSLILFIGLVQELLQLVTFKMHAFSLAELFDLMVDLLGAGLAFVLLHHFQKKLKANS